MARESPITSPWLFSQAVSLLGKVAPLIVEIGAIRDPNGASSDGHSTLQWPSEALIWSVDHDPRAIRLTRELARTNWNLQCVLANGLNFLRMFPGEIDILYLDGPHPEKEDGRTWHLRAYQQASMAPRSVVLIDDTHLLNRGKGELVIPAAQKDGYELIAIGRQTLLLRV